MKIAIISDTHNLFRPEIKEMIAECDALVHAGDVNSLKVLEEIRTASGKGKPFFVVRGNNDREWAKDLPEFLRFEMGGVKFFLVHNKKDVPENLGDIQIVIYGHSHKFTEEMIDGRLWLNPGSCGRRRFRSSVTMAVLHLEDEIYVDRGQNIAFGGNGMGEPQKFVCGADNTEKAQKEYFSGRFGKVAWRVVKIELDAEEMKRVHNEALAKQADFSEGKLVGIVTEIFERMDKGQTISYISKKVGMEEELVEQICRIRVTHPGVTPGGVVDKMEVNRVIIKYK